MPEQPLLPGITEPEPTDFLFLAIFPDASTAAHIERVARQLRAAHGLRGTPLERSRFHITLYPIGHYAGVPAGVVKDVSAIAGAIAASTSPFEVKFGFASSFSGKPVNRPLVLRTSGDNTMLMEFQRRLSEALRQRKLGKGGSSFTPHVTLLYDNQSVAEHSIDPVSWTVTEFVLVHSLQGQTLHIPLARWTLGN